MEKAITQRQAKVMIRDYLRKTGRRGVTSLIRDIDKQTKSHMFEQRTLEIWLKKQDRQLQDKNWEIILEFIKSPKFKQHVPYSSDCDSEKRLIQVADGLAALYCERKRLGGVYLLPSQIEAQGQEAIKLLDGLWNAAEDGEGEYGPRTDCKIKSVPGKRYAKLVYVYVNDRRYISVSGLVIYLGSKNYEDYKYYHTFVLHLWRRKDPESVSILPGELGYLIEAEFQPEFLISNIINKYFYRSGESSMRGAIVLRKQCDIEDEYGVAYEDFDMVDILFGDVLPHGLA